MSSPLMQLTPVAQLSGANIIMFAIIGFCALLFFAAVLVFLVYGKLWFQGFMSSADVTLLHLVGMGFRRVNPRVIVTAKVMAKQAGLNISRRDGISTERLEAHYPVSYTHLTLPTKA